MKISISLSISLILCETLSADIVPTPGTQPIGPVFDKSDLVCNCLVRSVVITKDSGVQSSEGAGRESAQRRIRAMVEIHDSFKSKESGHRLIVVEYFQDPLRGSTSQPALSEGETALLFLTATGSAIYGFADPFLGATPFSSLPEQSGELGLVKLQSLLADVVQRPGREDRIKALRLLQGFDNLDRNSISSINPLCISNDPEIAFSALAVLLKTKTPESVEKLRSYVEAYKGDAEPIALVSIATELAAFTDVRTLPSLERLTGSKYISIQMGAIGALRQMRDPRSASTLVQRLDDPDGTVKYLALITLAEIFGKYGDYAPSMYLFDKRSSRYINLWKEWWAQEQRKP